MTAGRRWYAVLSLSLALGWVSCVINPQPEPPGYDEGVPSSGSGASAGSGGAATGGSGGSSQGGGGLADASASEDALPGAAGTAGGSGTGGCGGDEYACGNGDCCPCEPGCESGCVCDAGCDVDADIDADAADGDVVRDAACEADVCDGSAGDAAD